MARQIFNQGLPNFFVVDSPLEIRELMRKSSTLLFVPTLALQRKFIEDSLTAAGMLVHRLDEAMWASQKVVVPGPAHPGRVLSSHITEASGWRIDAAEVQQVVFWGIQPIEHLASGHARVRNGNADQGVLLTSPVPGYVYIGA